MAIRDVVGAADRDGEGAGITFVETFEVESRMAEKTVIEVRAGFAVSHETGAEGTLPFTGVKDVGILT